LFIRQRRQSKRRIKRTDQLHRKTFAMDTELSTPYHVRRRPVGAPRYEAPRPRTRQEYDMPLTPPPPSYEEVQSQDLSWSQGDLSRSQDSGRRQDFDQSHRQRQFHSHRSQTLEPGQHHRNHQQQQQQRPQLRYARSATNLRAAHDPPQQGLIPSRSELPVGFVVDQLPTPPPDSPEPNADHRIRRVKSSSALSASKSASTSASASGLVATDLESKEQQSKWKAALGEAQYFAGGLISRPAESTRHYSIIRHSHALIWYRGPSTSVTITILSDDPLPPHRTVWLQQKGYSGNMGMSLKSLIGTTGSWINVTPATRASADNLPPVDERGIQRDLKRFAKKASGRQKKHAPRETHVIRIPAEATDGYFRLVVCQGGSEGQGSRKTLCGSPVFRIASTSTDASVVRGAGIRTMPLEVGVKVASTVGQQVARRYTGAAALVVENRVAKAAANGAVTRAATIGRSVIETTGAKDMVNESWQRRREGRYEAIVHESQLVHVPPESGPEAPFPLDFEGRVSKASGRSTAELGIPSANIRHVRDDIKMRMKGVFAAWACVMPSKDLHDISHDWHEAIVTIGPLRYGPPEVVLKNRVTVHLINDFDGANFFDAKVKVILMGYLHPALDRYAEDEEMIQQHAEDTMLVLESLGRELWTVEDALRRKRSFNEKLDGVTGAVQGKVDRAPVHWAGVRTETAAMRDRLYGAGGLWIPR
jgi:hypothetical protein